MKQEQIFKLPNTAFKNNNPMLKGGVGPEGKRCKECKHLYYKLYGKKYYKCALRNNTNGPATDHRVNWQACWKFKQKDNDNVSI